MGRDPLAPKPLADAWPEEEARRRAEERGGPVHGVSQGDLANLTARWRTAPRKQRVPRATNRECLGHAATAALSNLHARGVTP